MINIFHKHLWIVLMAFVAAFVILTIVMIVREQANEIQERAFVSQHASILADEILTQNLLEMANLYYSSGVYDYDTEESSYTEDPYYNGNLDLQ